MTNISAVEKMAELMQQMEENSPRVAALQYCLTQVEAKYAALAAELQSVKAMNDCLSEELRGYESDGVFEGPKMHLLWWQCETPNHDAFLAEVRAQGVEMFAQKCDSKSKQSLSSDIRDNWQLLGEHASDFAAQLRKGVRS